MIRLCLLAIPAKAAETASGTRPATFKNVDVEGSNLCHEPCISRIVIGMCRIPIWWRRTESRKLPLILVVGADDDVEMSLLPDLEMLSLLIKESLELSTLHDGMVLSPPLRVQAGPITSTSLPSGSST